MTRIIIILLITLSQNSYAFNIPDNPRIDKWVAKYSQNKRNHYQLSINRSGLYRETIVKIFDKEGLPEDLSWLPFIESGFNCTMQSRSKAAGCWQFMPRTGKYFGLSKDSWKDHRYDFNKSTVAAAKYLKRLYKRFGDWELALAAYNCGPGRVNKAVKKSGIDFWDLDLPSETEEYVPKFYAALKISRDLEKYGFLPPAEEVVFPVELKRGSHNLRYIASILGVKYRDFARINPGYETGYTSPSESTVIYIFKDWRVSILDGFGFLAKKNAPKIN